MLKVWRKGATLFAECTDCGSYGRPASLPQKLLMTPDIEAALERHTAHMMALRSHFEKAAGEIQRQLHDGSIERPAAVKRIREMWENHVAQVRLGEASLPNPDGKVKSVVTGCPWCNHQEQVDIEDLPEDKEEPDFALAVPVKAHIKKNMVKEG